MLSEIEQKKVERVVGALIAKRRPPPDIRNEVDLGYRFDRQRVEIYEIRPVWRGNGETHEIPIAKTIYVKARKVWRLYWQRRDLKWNSYKPLPEACSIEEVVAEIDVDPYACFWG